jgi:hypothetical protein
MSEREYNLLQDAIDDATLENAAKVISEILAARFAKQGLTVTNFSPILFIQHVESILEEARLQKKQEPSDVDVLRGKTPVVYLQLMGGESLVKIAKFAGADKQFQFGVALEWDLRRPVSTSALTPLIQIPSRFRSSA